MAKRDDALGVAGAATVIASGVAVKGNLVSDGDVVVDGEFGGDLRAAGTITIGINGVVKSNIQCSSLVVAGSLSGNVAADGDVSILESGQIHGDVTALGLSIAPGGIFAGKSAIRVIGPAPKESGAK